MGVLTVAPGAVTSRDVQDVPLTRIAPATTFEPFVAYVPDASGGEIVLHIGEREVVVRDAELVARLVEAAQ